MFTYLCVDDVIKNDRLDVFDLVILKKMLLNN